MARRKKAVRRRPKTFSLLNAVESFGYASIITKGLFRNDPVGFILGEGDLDPSSTWNWESATTSAAYTSGEYGISSGANKLTLRDLIKDPSFFSAVAVNRAMVNGPEMVIQSVALGAGVRIFKRLMRRPLSNIQRNIVKPVIGPGVRLA